MKSTPFCRLPGIVAICMIALSVPAHAQFTYRDVDEAKGRGEQGIAALEDMALAPAPKGFSQLQARAIAAIRDVGGRAAEEALLRILANTKSKRVRKTVVQSLTRFESRECKLALVAQLGKGLDDDVLRTLESICTPGDKEILARVLDMARAGKGAPARVLWLMIACGYKPAQAYALEQVGSGSSATRKAAIDALGYLGGTGASAKLKEIIRNDDGKWNGLESRAASALARLGDVDDAAFLAGLAAKLLAEAKPDSRERLLARDMLLARGTILTTRVFPEKGSELHVLRRKIQEGTLEVEVQQITGSAGTIVHVVGPADRTTQGIVSGPTIRIALPVGTYRIALIGTCPPRRMRGYTPFVELADPRSMRTLTSPVALERVSIEQSEHEEITIAEAQLPVPIDQYFVDRAGIPEASNATGVVMLKAVAYAFPSPDPPPVRKPYLPTRPIARRGCILCGHKGMVYAEGGFLPAKAAEPRTVVGQLCRTWDGLWVFIGADTASALARGPVAGHPQRKAPDSATRHNP